MNVLDCRDYLAFLQNIPTHWISRRRAAPGQPGWAPFRGPLSHQSHRQAVVIVSSMFAWLHAAEYVRMNPWLLVNRKTGDEKKAKLLTSKALSEAAFKMILSYIEQQPRSPSMSRILFILNFVESVGLRSQELLDATIGDLQYEPEGWLLQIHGKGAKNRLAAVPGQAVQALQEYVYSRGLGSIAESPAEAPLLASTKDPMEPVGYQALYETVKSWISKAVSASNLPASERLALAGATTHWLRHSFGTRAVAREVPLDVIQAQMGHASIQTTMSIYGRAPIKRLTSEMEKAFG
jgi:integrase